MTPELFPRTSWSEYHSNESQTRSVRAKEEINIVVQGYTIYLDTLQGICVLLIYLHICTYTSSKYIHSQVSVCVCTYVQVSEAGMLEGMPMTLYT